MLKPLLSFCIMLYTSFSFSQNPIEDTELAALFAEQSLKGTLVLSSLKTQRTFIHNAQRADRRFTAASTFKIPNTLIALEENVVTDQSSPFKWNGHHYGIASWNHDQTLQSAFQVSCVWCYQTIAQQVGIKAYRRYIQTMNYGKLNAGPLELTRFWLDGSLAINANEQIDVLKNVYNRFYPFKDSSYETLNAIMLVKQTSEYSIYAKTGWATDKHPYIGWYVGWVQTKEDTWFFALNLDVEEMDKLPLRQSILEKALLTKTIISS
ncbi:MAG: class D beta-lactamase [Thiomicrorhabdus chilensis]|nr:class D beta-lactamase [Thiomicrorhabdus chilensis]MDX1348453.1 class D beta-lactamase [Thiomicrorhabdus chilensis]